MTGVSDADAPIVVVGAHMQSLLMRVDAIPREGETVLGQGYEEPIDGGKATNQAVAAARLDAPVRFVSLLGDDDRGRRMLTYLAEQGIDIRFVAVVDGPTDVGFVMLPPNGIPAITSCQDLSARLDADVVASAAPAFAGASVVVCQLEAPVSCAIAAFRAGRAVGGRTILNPAPAIDVPPELLRLTDIIVPNHHEAAAILGREAEPSVLATELAATMPWADVVVTAGEDGAHMALADGRRRHIEASEVAVVDTTGAGDAFVGALATQVRLGVDLFDAVRYAVAAASVSVGRPGTMTAFASAGDVAAGEALTSTGDSMPANRKGTR